MKLKTKLTLILIFSFLLLLTTIEFFSYHTIKAEALNDLYREARNVRSVLMATRRVYHNQFIDSGLPLTDKTMGFLPAHAMSRISSDLMNWTKTGLYFNNVSDTSRNPKNAADSIEKEAISYFLKNPTEEERFVSFKTPEKESFYHFSAPIWVEEYCLKCHGKREDAPVTIRTNYATAFNYKVGDLRGIMSIKLPGNHLNARIWTDFIQNLWIHSASFLGMFFLISWLLNRCVNKPLNILTRGLGTVASGKLDYSIVELSGEMEIVANTFNDMSKQLKNRENALKESEGRLRAIIDNSTAVIYLKDTQGRFVMMNRQYEKLFNPSKSEMIGKTDYDIFTKEIADEFQKNDRKVLESGHPLEFEEIAQHKDGLHTYISLKFPLFDAENIAYGVCGISTDITEHKRIDEKLKVFRELDRNIITNTLDYNEIFEAATHLINKIVPCDRVTIVLVDEERGGFLYCYGWGTNIRKKGDLIPFGETDATRVVREHSMIHRKDLRQEKTLARLDKEFFEEGFLSDIRIPLIVDGKVAALLNIGNHRADRFNEEDIINAETIAGQLSIALKNSMLFKGLEKSSKEITSILESITDSFFTLDNKWHFVYVNPAAEKQLQKNHEELIGKNIWEEFSEAVGSTFYNEYHRAIAEKVTVTFEEFYPPFNKWFEVHAYPSSEGLSVYFRDTSERKLTEAKAKRQSDLLNAINKVLREALTCETEEKVGYMCLAVAEELTGSKFGFIGELNQKTGLFDTIALSDPGWDACLMPETKAVTLLKNMKIRGIDRSTLREEKSRIVNDPAFHPDRVGTPNGHPPLTSFLGVPLKRDGRTFGMIGLGNKESGYDLDDQKAVESLSVAFVEAITHRRIESALKESEEKFRTMCVSANDAIIMMDNEGKVSYWNESAEKIFGYSAEEVAGKELHELVVPNMYRKKMLSGLKIFLDTGRGPLVGKTVELFAKRKNGAEFPIDHSISAVNIKGKWHSIGIIRDITERKKMEENVRVSYKMASLGRMTAGVFHEVLNPLQIISSYTQLMLLKKEEDSERETYLKKILKEIERIVKITDSFLVFTRKGKEKVEDVEIKSLLEDIISIVEPNMKLENIKFIRKYEEKIPKITGNNDELRQVFMNLITNARAAMPEGGSLMVSTEKKEEGEVPFVRLKFTDTGCGIEKDKIDKIFEPFFTTKKETKGVGLGLGISFSIVERHGGELRVESKEGKGATFIIDLPAKI